MKILFLSGAALAQYAPPTTKKPDDYTTGPRLPDQKGVQVKRNLRSIAVENIAVLKPI